MNMKKKISIMILIVLTIIVFTACGDEGNEDLGGAANDNGKLVIAAGPKSSEAYKEGEKIAKELTDNGVSVEVLSTDGKKSNSDLIEDSQAQLAIVTRDEVDDEDVKLIKELYVDHIHVIATKDSKVTALDQLKDKVVCVGLKDSAIEDSAEEILEQYGINYMDLDVQYMDTAASIKALRDGKADVAFISSKLSNNEIKKLGEEKNIVFLSVGDNKIVQDLIDDGYEKAEIPAKTYGNKETVNTLSVKNILVARNDLSNDTINKMKDILKNYK